MRIYLSGLSLGDVLRAMDLRELPDLARCNGFDGIELSDRELSARVREELEGFARRCVDSGTRFILDINAELTHAGSAELGAELAHVSRMLVVAAELGARLARISLGGQSLSIQRLAAGRRREGSREARRFAASGGALRRLLLGAATRRLARRLRRGLPSYVRHAEAKTARATEALRRILPEVRRHGLRLAIENHWGITARPQNLVGIVERIGAVEIGTCPDLANFPREVDPYAGLELLAPRAIHVHAASARFRPDGEERDIDYARCLGILRASGYTGDFAVEYVGAGGLEGCRLARELILRHW